MLPEPTPDPIDPEVEAGELADLFQGYSDSLDDYRENLPQETPPDQLALLKRQAQELEGFSQRFTAEAIGATLHSIQADLAKIKAVTKEAKAQLGHLKTVSKVISIAAAGLSVGTAIVGGNPLAIGKAVEELGKEVAG